VGQGLQKENASSISNLFIKQTKVYRFIAWEVGLASFLPTFHCSIFILAYFIAGGSGKYNLAECQKDKRKQNNLAWDVA
jgi:hypothetical protein